VTASVVPTADQLATLAWLIAATAFHGAELDLEDPFADGTAIDGCDHDDRHGPGDVCIPGGYVCLACAVEWMRWHPGERVAPEVLRLPPCRPVITAVAR
jgi:hypothetical protein